MRFNVHLVDEDPHFSDALAVVVDKTSGLNVVRRFRSLTDSLINVRKYCPLVMILGNCGDTSDKINAVRLLRKHVPQVKVVVVLRDTDHSHLVKFIQAGASGAFSREANPKIITRTLRLVQKGKFGFDLPSLHAVVDVITLNHDGLLTPREQDVLQELSFGKTYQAICEQLSFTRGSLVKHISNLYGKLGVHTRVDALKKARERKYLAY